MQQLIGQDYLTSIFNSFTFNTMPKTSIIIGAVGSGKHTLVSNLADRLNIECVDLTTAIDSLNEQSFYYASVNKIFIINISCLTDKQQNGLLKFVEEPPLHANIILLAETEVEVLSTVLNRCVKYIMQPYTVNTLKTIFTNITDDIIFEICNTPGQLMDVNQKQIIEMYGMCEYIIKNCGTISYVNTIRAATKVNFKEEFNKYDFLQFIYGLRLAAFNLYTKTASQIYFNLYEYINKNITNVNKKAINKEAYLINMLDNIWRLTR